jgi:hypothetical protein
MILYANGCSWTWGAGLEESIRDKSAWPAQLAKILNADYVNEGAGCGSNQRIVRTTFNWLSKQSQETLKETLAVIQWTDEARYEYYVPNNDKQEDDNWAKVKIGVVLSANEMDIKRANKRADYRLETFTELEGNYSLLTHSSALADIFRMFDVKYYYWSNCGISNYPDHIKNFMLSNHNWLEKDGKHTLIYDRISPNDGHPNMQGHIQIAESIFKLLKP